MLRENKEKEEAVHAGEVRGYSQGRWHFNQVLHEDVIWTSRDVARMTFQVKAPKREAWGSQVDKSPFFISGKNHI